MRDDAGPGRPFPPGELDALAGLAARVVAVDGGMPLAADPAFLRSRWSAPGAAARVTHDDTGALVAAAAVRPSGESGSTVAMLADPASPHLSEELLDWGLAEAARRGGPAIVETESLTPELADRFQTRGLRQAFAEDVLRRDLAAPLPTPSWPEGATVHPWTAETAPRFFAAYDAAFRDRPGFRSPPVEEWIDDLHADEEFRPAWSALVDLPGVGAVGFVTALAVGGDQVGWIDQVGVVPTARGRGLGTALTAEALGRMRADGATEAWLNVNVDNPGAKSVYLRLGFLEAGRRARFTR